MDNMISKEFLGALALILGLCAVLPYLYGIIKGKTKPHVFTWIIWAILPGITFFAQVLNGGGPGAWATGAASLVNLIIAICAWRIGEKDIKRSDWITFIISLSAIPIWLLTKNPLWSVIIVTTIDVIATYPTIRKIWHKPFEEVATTYFLGGSQFAISLFALDQISWVTTLFPATIASVNCAIVILILARRRILKK